MNEKDKKELLKDYNDQDLDQNEKEANGDLCDICCLGACEGCCEGFGCL